MTELLKWIDERLDELFDAQEAVISAEEHQARDEHILDLEHIQMMLDKQ